MKNNTKWGLRYWGGSVNSRCSYSGWSVPREAFQKSEWKRKTLTPPQKLRGKLQARRHDQRATEELAGKPGCLAIGTDTKWFGNRSLQIQWGTISSY